MGKVAGTKDVQGRVTGEQGSIPAVIGTGKEISTGRVNHPVISGPHGALGKEVGEE